VFTGTSGRIVGDPSRDDSLESLGFLSVFKAYQIVSVPEDNDDRKVRISFSK
jgi:hypothetical protein